ADEMLAVLRETLTNVSRHASARNVAVHVAVDTANLTMVITDDGVGMAETTNQGGRGLRNMRERAADLGGTCSVDSRPGGGVRVWWWVRGAAGEVGGSGRGATTDGASRGARRRRPLPCDGPCPSSTGRS